MKKKVKLIIFCLVQLLKTLVSLVLVLLFSRKYSLKKSPPKKGRVLILGNGPSLLHDLDVVVALVEKGCVDVCAVNNFALSDRFGQIRPCLYVLADPNYWVAEVSQELELDRMRMVKIFNSEVTWPMRVMLPYEARNSSILKQIASEYVRVEFYNRTPIDGFGVVKHWLYDIGAGMPPPLNVMIAALSLCLVEGYQEIYISGADHSWHEELRVAESGKTLVAQKHFYDEKAELKPVYKGEGEFTIGDLFIRWGQVFKIYEALEEYSKLKGVRIINVSGKSYIDAFPRVRIEVLRELK